jgi:hypothetical protein
MTRSWTRRNPSNFPVELGPLIGRGSSTPKFDALDKVFMGARPDSTRRRA